MSLRNFLFTEKFPGRYYRHIAFWISSCLPFFLLGVISIFSKHAPGDLIPFLRYQLAKFPSLAIDIIYTYVIVYAFIPAFQRNKSVRWLVSRILELTFIAFVLKAFLWYPNKGYFHEGYEKFWLSSWFMLTNFFNDGSVMRCGLFLGCRMLKNYYLKSEEKLGILKENATAELQLLKAQVHPHFLFNTLNNIYSYSLKKSPVASSLVLKLSDTLRYMITDCEAPLVPLEKELKMVEDYISLESVRYGVRLNVEMNIEGDAGNKNISPLLLIPLVENSFKHGTSQMLEKPWIRMKIEINDDMLRFELHNSKPPANKMQEGKNGIGLKNVRKRLQLLYPSQHELRINNMQDSFEVFIRVPLHAPGVRTVVGPETKDYGDLILSYGSG